MAPQAGRPSTALFHEVGYERVAGLIPVHVVRDEEAVVDGSRSGARRSASTNAGKRSTNATLSCSQKRRQKAVCRLSRSFAKIWYGEGYTTIISSIERSRQSAARAAMCFQASARPRSPNLHAQAASS